MHLLHALIGPDQTHLGWPQVTLRGLIVFAVGLGLIRASGLRTFSRYAPIDTVVTVLIGSNLSRAMTGSAPFVPTLAASLAIVAAHRVLASAALRSPWLNRLLKGEARPLVVGGQVQEAALRREAITRDDLCEAMRLRGLDDLGQVTSATLERNGQISLQKAS
jgi:uncharacterized membrane protein YcaP (DUF421 family)